MAKSKVKKLSSYETLFKENYENSGSYFYNLKTTSSQTYVVDKVFGFDHYLVVDYSPLNPSKLSKAYAIRENDDLIFVAKIFKGNKLSKTITTTIKDYYKNNNGINVENVLAAEYANGSYYRSYWHNGELYYQFNKETNEFKWYIGGFENYHPYTSVSGIINSKEYSSGYLAGSKKNDYYTVTTDGIKEIYEEAGNDVYNMKDAQAEYIRDYAGNDKYIANNTGIVSQDFAGNDSYYATVGSIYSEDYAGNDKYELYDTDGESEINDYAGNDFYSATEVETELKINDGGGNDKYVANTVGYLGVVDQAGNDDYNLSNITELYLTDGYTDNNSNDNRKETKSGNDKYTLTKVGSNSNDSSIEDSKGNDKYIANVLTKTDITDNAGNDIYDLSQAKSVEIADNNGKDKYTVKNSNTLTINEEKGSDNYTFENSKNITVNDNEIVTKKKAANDTYNITLNSLIFVNDEAGADKYNLTDSGAATITDNGGSDFYAMSNGGVGLITDNGKSNDTYKLNSYGSGLIGDDGGKDKYEINGSVAIIGDLGGDDTYTISSKSLATIQDKVASPNQTPSNDTYKINGMDSEIVISDESGTKDKMVLSGVNKDDLIFMANFNLKTTDVDHDISDGSLYIFNKKTFGFIEIKDYFEKESHGDGKWYVKNNSRGNGVIENISIGKNSINSLIASYADKCPAGGEGSLAAEVAYWMNISGYDKDTYSSVENIMNAEDRTIAADFIATFVHTV